MATYASKESVEQIIGRPLTTDEAALFPMVAGAIDQYINDALGGVGFGNPDPSTRYYDNIKSQYLEIDPVYLDLAHKENNTDAPIDFTVQYVDNLDNPTATVDKSTYAARPRNEKVKTYLQLRNGIWRRGVANVAITGKFTRGLTVPDDVAYAANYLAAQYLVATNEDSLSLDRESIEGYSRTFATIARQNPVIIQIFDKYKDIML